MTFAEVQWTSIAVLILEYHYLHRKPAGILACYALYKEANDLTPIGAAVFCNGRIQYEGKYIEFSRLWIDDCMPTNTESWFVSRALKSIQKKYPHLQGCVTWADPKIGHTGALYRALNFSYDGESRKVKRYKNKRTGATVFQRTVIDATEFDEIEPDGGKKRFVYYFNKKEREKLR